MRKTLLLFMLSFLSLLAISQTNSNIFHWDYTNEAKITSAYSTGLVNLTDKNEATLYTVVNSTNMEVDFELANPLYCSGFLVYSGNLQQKISMANIQLLASNDKSNWTTATISIDSNVSKNTKGDAGQIMKVDLETKGAFRYFKLKYSGQNNISLAEFQLFGYPGVTNGNYPDDLIQVSISDKNTKQESAFGNNGIYSFSDNGITGDSYIEVASHAIDGLKNKYTVNGTSLWIQYNFETDVIVKQFSIAVGTISNTDRNPRNFRLVASDNWGITWQTLAEYSDFIFPATNYVNMKFQVPNARDYLYYRLEVTANNGGDMTHVSEIQLLGEVPSYSSVKNINSDLNINYYSKGQKLFIKNNESENFVCNIYNLQGNLLQTIMLNSSTIEIPLNKGLYILEAQSLQNSKTFRSKIIIQ